MPSLFFVSSIHSSIHHGSPSFHVIHFLKDPFKSLRLYWRRISLHTFSPPCLYTQPASSIHLSIHPSIQCAYWGTKTRVESWKREKKATWIFYLFVHWGIVQFELEYFFFCFSFGITVVWNGSERVGGWVCSVRRVTGWLRFKVRDRVNKKHEKIPKKCINK